MDPAPERPSENEVDAEAGAQLEAGDEAADLGHAEGNECARSLAPLYGALDVKRFPSRFSDIAYPYVRSTGPSLRPDHEGGRTRGWAEVKDGPQGHRRRRRPASLRSAHPRVTLGGLGSDDWPALWVSRSKAEFPRPWTAARSNNLVFGPARGRRP